MKQRFIKNIAAGCLAGMLGLTMAVTVQAKTLSRPNGSFAADEIQEHPDDASDAGEVSAHPADFFASDEILDYPEDPEIADLAVPESVDSLDMLAYGVDLALYQSVENGGGMVYFSLEEPLLEEAKEDPEGFVIRVLQVSLLGHNFCSAYDDSRLNEGLLGFRTEMPDEYATEVSAEATRPKLMNYEFYRNSLQKQPEELCFSKLPICRNAHMYLPAENSEQLLFAVEYGYLPLCSTHGTAAEILRRCIGILSQITSEQMTETERYKAIYQYVLLSNQYDYDTLLDIRRRNTDNRVFFLEGSVLDGKAVCDGLCKELVLLSRLAGLEAFHVGAKGEESGHAYVYVKADGNWYLSCPAYGSDQYTGADGKVRDYHTQNYMLTDFDTNMEGWPYDSEAFPAIEAELRNTESYDYWSRAAVDIDGKAYTLHPETVEDALAVLEDAGALQKELHRSVEVELCGSVRVLRDAYQQMKKECGNLNYLSGGTFEQQRLQVYVFEDDDPRLFADELEEQALPRPSRVIASLDDFIYALDYLAFYRIGDTVYFEFAPEYAESFYNPYTEFQKAYLRADLADVYACDLKDSGYSREGVAGIRYSMSRDIASVPPEHITDTPVVPSFDYTPDGDPELTIWLEEQELEQIPCENGEQLYYLVMNGYKPVPEPGSVAGQLYEAAVEVLRSCIRPDYSDFEKIKAVYDWLTTEVVYDKDTAYSGETYLVQEQAYYLEGVFFDHCAVCDGKAKACALLLNMLGIPCFRETGVGEYGDHAWNLVELEGKWYLLCSTYGQTDRSDTLGRIVPNYSMLLSGKDTPLPEIWGYVPQKRPDMEEQIEARAYDIYGEMGRIDGLDLKIADFTEFKALFSEIWTRAEGEYKLEFVYEGLDQEQFEDQLLSYLETIPGANAAEIKQNGGTAYQVICLSEE